MNKLIISCTAILVALGAFLGFRIQNKVPVRLGSIGDGQSYNSTTTQSSWASNAGGFQLIKPGYGTLGSVVLTNSSFVGTINLYDATTTVNGAVYATSTLASINAGTQGGTYTFDVSFSRGLIAVPTAGIATSTTITWR